MKLTITFFTFLLMILSNSQAQESSAFHQSFAEKWERTKAYTIAVAEAMPMENYDEHPAEDIMSFREELQHMVNNFTKLQYFVTGEKTCAIATLPERFEEMSKEEIIAALDEGFNYVGDLWANTPEKEMGVKVDFFAKDVNMTKEGIFHLMRNHVTHHRGRLTLMLRLKGVKPPRYVGW
ncbi:DinB family protein [Algivirga pacifica]|uniref:Damage-inducible protein DinB n=1 Tax=Algivirga pacifica TaxID=1162670 RepID=A0ABP9D7Y4_9BACT